MSFQESVQKLCKQMENNSLSVDDFYSGINHIPDEEIVPVIIKNFDYILAYKSGSPKDIFYNIVLNTLFIRVAKSLAVKDLSQDKIFNHLIKDHKLNYAAYKCKIVKNEFVELVCSVLDSYEEKQTEKDIICYLKSLIAIDDFKSDDLRKKVKMLLNKAINKKVKDYMKPFLPEK